MFKPLSLRERVWGEGRTVMFQASLPQAEGLGLRLGL